MLATPDRTTKYTLAVRQHVQLMGHATNAELTAALRGQFPGLSATTVHRITARLVNRGELQMAPSGNGNTMRFDANLRPHDHFICSHCGNLKDMELGTSIRLLIERSLGDGCSISGSLTVSGLCKHCRA